MRRYGWRAAFALGAAALAGCFTSSDDGDSLVSARLSETRLIGGYLLVDYLFEYGDGARYDPSNLPLTGSLSIGTDSAYLDRIVIGKDTTDTEGRIAGLKTESGDKDRGELLLTLRGADTAASGKSVFSFRHDTLMLVTEVSKERDASKKGFRETAYYLREAIRKD
jgi:hypothetical protein